MLSVCRLSIRSRICSPAAACPIIQHERGVRTKVKKWKKALLYPPDFDDHHIHLPSLKDYENDMEAIRNPVTILDIGLSHEEFSSRSDKDAELKNRSQRKAAASKSLEDYSHIDSPEALVRIVDVKPARKSMDYTSLQIDWLKSNEGKNETLELAHHYHIFRDLFSSPSQVPVADPVPKVVMPKFKPYPDRILHDLFYDWFPGSVRYKSLEPRNIYHFLPHVPIHAEFEVNEKKIAAEEEMDATAISDTSFVCSPVFRGNLITPLYASVRPSVLIDLRSAENDDCVSYSGVMKHGETVLLKDKSAAGKHHYTLALLSLDTILGDEKPVCHWMLANISDSGSQEEVMSFMPVYGIRGLGYHRYVFLLMRHEQKLQLDPVHEFSLTKRKFDPLDFIKKNDAVPVGLSWFQSTWDDYSQKVLHNDLDMRSPVYEYIEPAEHKQKQVKHPFCAPFNIYLDHFRDPKELNEEALLKRLKKINPFDYTKEFDVDPLPNAYGEIRDIEPSWRQSTVWKERNRFGHFRHMRPVSAKIPLNNNTDLDYPFWPPRHRHHVRNLYPDSVKVKKPLRETKWVLPPNEHPQHEVYHADERELNDADRRELD